VKPERIPVLVTAIGCGGLGEQILKALCLAGRDRFFIVGADAQAQCPHFSIVDRSLVLPRADDSCYVESVLDACTRFGLGAVFCGCEPELKRLSAERARFAAQGVLLPINPAEVIEMCMDKQQTGRRLAELGFAPPRFVAVRSREELESIDWFPVVVKPSTGSGGSSNCFIAQSRRQLIALADYLGLENMLGRFLVQEYVGVSDEEYTVGVLHDMDGNFINSIAVRRILSGALNTRVSVQNVTGRPELGPRLVISSGVSHGYVGRFPNVTQPCEQIAAALGVRGPVNIQCRYVSGTVKVFEINPRFSGTTSIRAMMGYNEPDILLRKHLLGETIQPYFDYQEGLVLRSLVEYRVPHERLA
jgi:carbamoyl-phosphate synthase large subunit